MLAARGPTLSHGLEDGKHALFLPPIHRSLSCAQALCEITIHSLLYSHNLHHYTTWPASMIFPWRYWPRSLAIYLHWRTAWARNITLQSRISTTFHSAHGDCMRLSKSRFTHISMGVAPSLSPFSQGHFWIGRDLPC